MKVSIYSITNIINNKVYIGMSQKIEYRKYRHFWMLDNNRHDNEKLQNAYNKYGKSNFIFKEIDSIDTDDIMKALDLEHYYIMYYDSYRNGYNKSIGYDGSTLIEFTPERLEKMSKAMMGNSYGKGKKMSEKQKKIISLTQKGKRLSAETRNKISLSRIGKYDGSNNAFYGKHHTEETKQKIREKANKRKVQCIETGEVFDSISECSRIMNVNRSNLGKVCRGTMKRTGGYTFQYID